MVRGNFFLSSTQKLLSELKWARQATTAGSAASHMMKANHQRAGGRSKVKVYRNKRKNLTKAERIVPEKADWPSIFAVAQSFNPAIVPLPIRMGRARPNRIGDIPPVAQGNIELLKIPNFFHLTPPAIQRHCEALKTYCTPWPEDIGNKPVRIVTNNYIYSGPSIRHPASKKVTLKVYLKDLDLDDHARTKMILLAGPERYCKNTDELSISEDRCPTRQQNKEYAFYLLAALYQESWKTEDWENEKPEELALYDLQERISDLLKSPIKLKEKLIIRRNQKRPINGQLIRFNRHGKAFVVENRKYGIYGPPSEVDKVAIAEEWEKIKS
eukprot:gene5143-269_t